MPIGMSRCGLRDSAAAVDTALGPETQMFGISAEGEAIAVGRALAAAPGGPGGTP